MTADRQLRAVAAYGQRSDYRGHAEGLRRQFAGCTFPVTDDAVLPSTYNQAPVRCEDGARTVFGCGKGGVAGLPVATSHTRAELGAP